MGNPNSPGNPANLLRGRVFGTRNKRTLEGEDFAKDILSQSDDDILVETTDDGKEVEIDRHPRAVSDPVYRALRRQARAGVGTMPGQLPPAVFNALNDRAFGKVADKVKVAGGRPLVNESDDELQARLTNLATALAGTKERSN